MSISDRQITAEKPLYLQEVHLFTKNGRSFAYLTRQMVALQLSEIAFEILGQESPITLDKTRSDFNGRYSVAALSSALETLKEWRLLDYSAPKPRPIQNSVEYIKEQARQAPSEIWLSLSNDCNLRCRYCSAGYGRFGRSPKLMTKEIASRGIDLLFSEELSENKQDTLNVIFVGGEPLLNYDVMAFSVDYAKRQADAHGKRVRFHLNTNGTLLDDRFKSLFLANDFEVTFSIDGEANRHDASRRYATGDGTYRDVERNFLDFHQKTSKSMRAQAVLTKDNRLDEAMTHLLSLGFDEIIPNPEYGSKLTDYESSFDASAFDAFAHQYSEWTPRNIKLILDRGRPVGNVHLLQDMRALHHRKPCRSSCGAGRSLGVSAHGGIFPCQSLMESQDHQLGSVEQGLDIKKREEFIALTERLADKCRGCWIEGACARPCFQEAEHSDFLDAHEPTQRCDLYRSYFEDAIYGYALLDDAGRTDILS